MFLSKYLFQRLVVCASSYEQSYDSGTNDEE